MDNDSVGAGGGGRFENESSLSVKLGDPATTSCVTVSLSDNDSSAAGLAGVCVRFCAFPWLKI